MSLGDRIRCLRGKLSQAEFGKKISLAQPTVRNYERGERKPDAEILNTICNIFGVSPEWLLMGTGPMYREREHGETVAADMSAARARPTQEQLIDFIDFDKNKIADMSAVQSLQQENRELQRELSSLYRGNATLQAEKGELIRESATLQIELERARLDLERRDMRIAELEREVTELRAVIKPARAADSGGVACA